jgi:glycosyltransferase involved in cell wall biosynthesis
MPNKDKSQKKKILFISTKSVWGGAQRYIVDLIDYLPKDQFDMEVAAGGVGPFVTKVRERNIIVHTIPELDKLINPIKDLRSMIKMYGIIKRVSPDILHLNSSKATGLGALSGWLAGVSLIISSTHGWPFLESRPRWQRWIIKQLERFSMLLHNKVICVSQFDYSIGLHERIAPANKLIPIHNGVDPKKHVFLDKKTARDKLFFKAGVHPNDKTFVIGTIAEYTKNKGLSYLIEAATHIVSIEPDMIFLLIGWGEEKAYLEEQIVSRFLEKNVYLIDFLPEAFTYLKAFDIFVLPSIKEGFAYSLLEASLAELPIIATRVGGNPEIIENLRNGILLKPASPEDIINSISYLKRDAGDRAIFSGAARQRVIKEFSIESMIKKTIEVYSS